MTDLDTTYPWASPEGEIRVLQHLARINGAALDTTGRLDAPTVSALVTQLGRGPAAPMALIEWLFAVELAQHRDDDSIDSEALRLAVARVLAQLKARLGTSSTEYDHA